MEFLSSVPDELEAPAIPSYDERRRRILGSFWRDDIEPVPVSVGYQLGLVAVALAMVTLPVLYVAFVAGLVAGLFWFFTSGIVFKIGLTGLIGLGAYGIVGFVGGVLVVFLVKPLFLPRWRAFPPRPIRRDQEPLLFDFLERICDIVGASMPKRVLVDCEVNASAGLRRGWASFFSQDLVLTLGLPLAAGLSVQQLAGVIAHELGHFAQSAGMRLRYVIGSVNGWLSRVVYGRDILDVWLYRQLENSGGWATLVFRLCIASVRWTRRVMWLFMLAGHAISCYFSRQQELDADLYEARLVGAETFEATLWDLITLGVAQGKTYADLSDSWSQGRLADDFSRMVVDSRAQLPAMVIDKLRQQVASDKTRLWDTHPTNRERVRKARLDGSTPIFSCDLPASMLFQDFDELTKKISFDLYRTHLGSKVQKKDLHSLDDVLRRNEQTSGDREAFRRFFRDAVTVLRPLQLEVARWRDEIKTAQDALAAVKKHRETLREGLPKMLRDGELFAGYYEELLDSYRVEALLAAGVPLTEMRTAAQRYGANVHERMMELEKRLLPLEEAAGKSLLAALFLMRSAEVSQKVGEVDQFRKDAGRLLKAVQQLHSIFPDLRELWQSRAELAVLAVQTQGDGRLQACLEATVGRVWGNVCGVHRALDKAEYPLDHADAKITLQSYLVPKLPEDPYDRELEPISRLALDRAFDVYFKVLSRLAYMAEKLEQGAGLEPLPPVKRLALDDESVAATV